MDYDPSCKCMDGGDSLNLNFGDNIMQYTGLKDKNGKEIYEGDVVSYEFILFSKIQTKTQWIQYAPEVGSFVVAGMNGKGDLISAIGSDILEIIGNIYENKELLK